MVVNEASVKPQSHALTEAAAENSSPCQLPTHAGGVFFSRGRRIRTGMVVNEASVKPQSRPHGLRPASLKTPHCGVFRALGPFASAASGFESFHPSCI